MMGLRGSGLLREQLAGELEAIVFPHDAQREPGPW
jgi:hypothetical protein